MSKITVLRSVKTTAPKGYEVVELAYKTDEGKTKGMKLLSFLHKEPFAVAANAKPGEVLEAQFKQNDKGYWEFASLKSTGEVAKVVERDQSVMPPTGTSRSGNWETVEERADRQSKISKQAVLNTSVAFFEAAKVKPSKEDVVEVAKYFLEFVNNKVVVTGDVA